MYEQYSASESIIWVQTIGREMSDHKAALGLGNQVQIPLR